MTNGFLPFGCEAIAFIQSGGVQKLSGAVFCKAGTGEKLTINIVSNQWRIGITATNCTNDTNYGLCIRADLCYSWHFNLYRYLHFYKLYHYLKHLQRFRFRSEFRTEKLCVTLRLKSARQKYKNVLSIGIC